MLKKILILLFLLSILLVENAYAIIDPAALTTLANQLAMLKKQYHEIKQSYGELQKLNDSFKRMKQESKEMADALIEQGKIDSFNYSKLDYQNIIDNLNFENLDMLNSEMLSKDISDFKWM